MGRQRKGQTISVEARTWYDMIYRCHKPTHARFKDYGAKGVTVCDEWRGPGGRDRFVEHMGKRPDGHVLGRRDHTKGYTPENCLWMSRGDQRRKQANVPKIEIDGETVALIDAAEERGINGRLARRRVCALGWTPEEAMERKPGTKHSKLDPHKVREIRRLIRSRQMSKTAIAAQFEVSVALICDIASGKKWASVKDQ